MPYIDLDGTPRPVGLLRHHALRREATVTTVSRTAVRRRLTVSATVSRSQIVLRRRAFATFQTKSAWILRDGPTTADNCRTGFSVLLTVSTTRDRAETPSPKAPATGLTTEWE
jgi:hypothetical protein